MTDLHTEVREGREPALVWGHGLLQSMPTGPVDPRAVETDHTVVVYDARNHGRSPDASSADELTWPALAADMIGVADAHGFERFVAGGTSMGAATALTLATVEPERVVGLVLAIPPTAWGVRWGQRTLYGSIGAIGGLLPVDGVRRAARSLRGASRTDLPPLEELARIDVPTLVLSWRFDPSHPSVVARRIADALPDSELLVTDRPGDTTGWHERIGTFLGERFG